MEDIRIAAKDLMEARRIADQYIGETNLVLTYKYTEGFLPDAIFVFSCKEC